MLRCLPRDGLHNIIGHQGRLVHGESRIRVIGVCSSNIATAVHIWKSIIVNLECWLDTEVTIV